MSEPDAAAQADETPQTGEPAQPEPAVTAEETDTVIPEDPVLLGAYEQAKAAIAEVTDPADIGAPAGAEMSEARVATLFFECRLLGYPGWRWAASLTRVDEDSPITVLEVELLPGEGAVVAPEWVPWSERLAQFRDAQSQESSDDETDDDADEDTDEDTDEFDGDEDDIDGVDIDELDDDGAQSDDTESDARDEA